VRRANPDADMWRKKLSGECIAAAYLTLKEIENAQIR